MIKNIFSNRYLLLIFRIIIGFIFIYSGYVKIIDTAGFSDAVSNYKLLPLFAINFAAVILPWIEITSGLLLLFGITGKENAFIINLLLSLFIVAIAVSLFRGLNINCGCFGTVGGTKVGLLKIIENSILLFMGILVMIFDSKYLTLKDNIN